MDENKARVIADLADKVIEAWDRDAQKPIDMILFCPNCGLQHVDGPDREDDPSMLAAGITHKMYDGWTNPPHRSHLCSRCHHIWRPADVPTNGVWSIKTAGKNDSTFVNPVTEAWVRRKIVRELRSSAFLHCDVNKEHVLLCIKHGCTLEEALKREEQEKNGVKPFPI